jgi:tellurium resistance protein TerD
MLNFTESASSGFSGNSALDLDITKQDLSLDLSKTPTYLNKIYVGASWDAPIFDSQGESYDLDLIAVFLNANGKLLGFNRANVQTAIKGMLWYHNPTAPGMRFTTGDNLTGSSAQNRMNTATDDEEIEICLNEVPADLCKIVFWIDINEIRGTGPAMYKLSQTFGQIENARITVYDENKNVLARLNLNQDYVTDTAVCAGQLERTPSGWEYNVVDAKNRHGIFDVNGIWQQYI